MLRPIPGPIPVTTATEPSRNIRSSPPTASEGGLEHVGTLRYRFMGRLSTAAVTSRLAKPPVVGADARSADRLERLVAAGRALMQERGTDFAMQAVAERARTSLRSLYEHFANKDEFLLAVFEYAIRDSAALLRADVETQAGRPMEQLRAYVEHIFHATFADSHPETSSLIRLHLHLAHANPEALARILAPQNDVLIELLQAGVA